MQTLVDYLNANTETDDALFDWDLRTGAYGTFRVQAHSRETFGSLEHAQRAAETMVSDLVGLGYHLVPSSQVGTSLDFGEDVNDASQRTWRARLDVAIVATP